MSLSNAQQNFIKLEKQRESIKKYFDEMTQACKEVAAEIGINGMFQDQEGTVYQVIEPSGKFVHFEKISYIRTKRPGEERGDLSVKKAQEAGFILPK